MLCICNTEKSTLLSDDQIQLERIFRKVIHVMILAEIDFKAARYLMK